MKFYITSLRHEALSRRLKKKIKITQHMFLSLSVSFLLDEFKWLVSLTLQESIFLVAPCIVCVFSCLVWFLWKRVEVIESEDHFSELLFASWLSDGKSNLARKSLKINNLLNYDTIRAANTLNKSLYSLLLVIEIAIISVSVVVCMKICKVDSTEK